MTSPETHDGRTGARMLALAALAIQVLDERARSALAAFVRGAHVPGGGYRGRSGAADPYYDAFGFALARLLGGAPDADDLRHLDACAAGSPGDLVHLASLLRARALAGAPLDPTRWTAEIGRFRTPDGGWRRSPADPPEGRLYPAFVAALAYEALDRPPEPRPDFAALVARFRTPEGGCCGERGGPALVPVTAAAVVLLDAAHEEVPGTLTAWLARCRDAGSGGFRASATAPLPDLLSTAVALYALAVRQALPQDWVEGTGAFVESCWRDDGGFAASPDSGDTDLEYTWYALLALGCLVGAS